MKAMTSDNIIFTLRSLTAPWFARRERQRSGVKRTHLRG